MNKPVTMAMNELKQDIINLVNDSKLPFAIIEYILADVLRDVQVMSVRQLQLDTENYKKHIDGQQKEAGV